MKLFRKGKNPIGSILRGVISRRKPTENHHVTNKDTPPPDVSSDQTKTEDCCDLADEEHLSPDAFLRLAFSYQSSMILLAATELKLFTLLAKEGPLTHLQIRSALQLHPRATPDWTDSLVALEILQRTDDNNNNNNNNNNIDTALYSNTPEAALFLDEAREETYIGASLDNCSKLMRLWTDHPKLLQGRSTKSHVKLIDLMKHYRTAAKAHVFRASRFGDVSGDERGLLPDRIYDVAFSFWTSRALLTATQFHLFTLIESSEKQRLSLSEIAHTLKLRTDDAVQFLDVLVTKDVLTRVSGAVDDTAAVYANKPAGSLFLDRRKASYIGGFMELNSKLCYGVMSKLVDSLQTGKRQIPETPSSEDDDDENDGAPMQQTFEALYEDPVQLEDFMAAMQGFGHGTFRSFCQMFDFADHHTFVDIGGASGQLSSYLVQSHPHLRGTSTELPPVIPIAEKNIHKWGASDRVKAIAHDFLTQEFPPADLVLMSLIILDWNLDQKKMLIRKAYDALPAGGELYVLDHFIDNERRKNLLCLCMSMFLMPWHGANGGFTFTANDLQEWCREAGFQSFESRDIPGVPMSVGVARK